MYINQVISPPVYYTLSRTLPYSTPSFVGRHNEIKDLRSLLEHTSRAPRIVSITGGPGFGKSTLAIYMGNRLMRNGTDVIYIDIDEVTSMHILAYQILRIRENSLAKGNVTMQDLYQWSSSLEQKTLLILDNCDQQFHKNNDFQKVIKRILKHSKSTMLKILTTSRQQVGYTDNNYHIYIINELPAYYSCKLLLGITKSLSPVTCKELANITGRVPLALYIIAALLNMPDPPKPEKILMELKENLIGTLSPEELELESRVNASIFLSYQYLDDNVQKVGQYLSFFPGSFKEDAAYKIVQNLTSSNIYKCLQVLVRRSLLYYNQETKKYVYHTLIRGFFKASSTYTQGLLFNANYLSYYHRIILDVVFISSSI